MAGTCGGLMWTL